MKPDLLRHRLNVEGSSGQANSECDALSAAESDVASSRGNQHVLASEQAARPFPILLAHPSPPLEYVEEFYPVGVLSDSVAVARLRCGHLIFDLTERRDYALCTNGCGWS